MPGPVGPSPKLLGRIAAVVMAVGFALVIWWSMSRGAGPIAANPPRGPDYSDIPDITELETGESIVITLVDRDDPSRITGVIEAERFDPVGNGERILAQPRAWLYMNDGRAVRVLAEQARLLMPAADQAPESGTLEGDVRLMVYGTTPAPGVPPPDDAEPIVTARFDQPVRFERRYLRLTSPGAFTVNSDRVVFKGEDLTIMLNQVRQRLEVVDVGRGGRMEILVAGADTSPERKRGDGPAPDPDTTNDAPPILTAPPPTTTTPSDAPPDPPTINLYHTTLNNTVVATLGTTRVDADRLDLYTRLTDNQLSPSAIARVGFAPTSPDPAGFDGPPASAPPEPLPENGVATLPDTPLPPPSPVTGDAAAPPLSPDTLVLTWNGPMSVRPIDTDSGIPAQLEHDDAALALHADQGKAVRFADPAREFEGDANALHYAATRGVLTLEAGDAPVRLTLKDTGEGTFGAVRADLLAGKIDLAGPAAVRSETGADLAWTQTARLSLETDAQGRMTDRLTAAAFSGEVRASEEGGQIHADALDTRFAPGPDARPALRTAVITNGTVAAEPSDAGLPRSLSGGVVRVDFAGEAGEPKPIRVEATGSVHALADGATLDADHAVATLARDALGETFVRTAHARGKVLYTDRDSTEAAAETLAVDGLLETIQLTGPDATVARDDSVIHGRTIDLDARARRMSVEGEGRFEHTLRDDQGLPAGKVLARWSESMRFDDALGRLACLGDVSVVSTPDAYTRDTLSAQRVEVEMTPRPIADPIGDGPPTQREVTLARAFGGATADTPDPATIETRSYDPANPERVTGLLYLESDQIIADAEHSMLRVPAAGTLLVMDRRTEPSPEHERGDGLTTDSPTGPHQPTPTQPSPDQPDPDADAPPTDPLGGSVGPGLTRFTWAGSMQLDRAAGVATMDGDVLVRHKTLDAGENTAQIAELACDSLTASFRELTGAEAAGSFALDTADAFGSVVFRASGKELLADAAKYDAGENILHALAAPGRTITLIEPGRPAPLHARAIVWDLGRDLIEINRPSPIVLPN